MTALEIKNLVLKALNSADDTTCALNEIKRVEGLYRWPNHTDKKPYYYIKGTLSVRGSLVGFEGEISEELVAE